MKAASRTPPGGDDRGSGPVEFLLVGLLLTAMTLAVLQLALAVYVRNVVHDAAVEGAHLAALADTSHAEGAARARAIITRAVGAQYAEHVDVIDSALLGYPTIEVRIVAALPVLGLIGMPGVVEVAAHAPTETLD